MKQPPLNLTSCSLNFTIKYLEFEDVIGGLTVVLCGVVTVLILCLKAYKTFMDRLMLYITISTFLFYANLVLQTVSLMENKVKESVLFGVCCAVGYLNIFALWTMMLFLMVISFYFFFLVAFQIKVSKCEILTVVSIPIASAVIASVPFMTKSYEASLVSGCSIILSEDSNQSIAAGFAELMVLGFGPPLVVNTFASFTAVYVAWVICREKGARRQHMEAVKETVHLVFYPLINVIVTFVILAQSIDNIIDPHCQKVLSWLSAALTPLSGMWTILALLFHIILTEHRRRKRIESQRTESVTRYTVPPEFPSEVDPLVITGARPQEPETAYKSIYLPDTLN